MASSPNPTALLPGTLLSCIQITSLHVVFLHSARLVHSMTARCLSADESDRVIGTTVAPVRKVGGINLAVATGMKITTESGAVSETAIVRGTGTVRETGTESGNIAIVRMKRCVLFVNMCLSVLILIS